MGLLSSLNAVAKYLTGMAARVLGLASGSPAAADGGGGGSGGGLADDGGTLAWLRERFAEDVRNNFAGGHDPDRTKWQPLKWRTGRPLILTGLLMNSAYYAAQHVQLRNGTEIMATMSQPSYWMFHEYGTSKIPARPFFGPSPETVQGLAYRIAQDMAATVVGSGE